MSQQLKELRERIQQCKKFAALCDRIKALEKVVHETLPQKLVKLRSEYEDCAAQLDLAAGKLSPLEGRLTASNRVIGAFEEGLARADLEAMQVRVRVLTSHAGMLKAKIDDLQRDIELNDKELETMYAELEEAINKQGLSPDTVLEELLRLSKQKDLLVERTKQEISAGRSAPVGEANDEAFRDGVQMGEADFFQALMQDLSKVAKSVEVVSPHLLPESAQEIMSVLAGLSSKGRSITVYTSPPAEQGALATASGWREVVVDAYRKGITLIHKNDIQYNAVIIDGYICWEGTVNILAMSSPEARMRRTTSSFHVRELRHYLFNTPGV